jgi:prevent-host-death family protein
MAMVPARELRNHTNDVLRRVSEGEDVTITSNGVPVAVLLPIGRQKRATMSVDEFLGIPRLDPGFMADVRGDWETGDWETTDDLGPIQ